MSIRNSYIPTNFYTSDTAERTSNAYWLNENDLKSQSFLTTSKYRLLSIDLYLEVVLGLGLYTVELFASDGSRKPTGSALLSETLASNYIEDNGAGWYNFTVMGGPVLTDATHYVIVIGSTSPADKDTRLAYSDEATLSGTAFKSYDRGVTWVAAQVARTPPIVNAINFPFKVYGTDPEPGIAITPSPSYEVTNQPSDITLSWVNGTVTATVDVYFDDFSPPSTKVIDDEDVSTYDPGGIAVADEFFWRVDCKNAHGTTTGTIWSFETGPQIAVSNKAELQAIKDNPTAIYYLTNDIDITGAWTPIGNLTDGFFTGSLDGRGFTVSNLTLSNTSNYQGLFGVVDSAAVIFDLTLKDVSMTVGGPGGCLIGLAGSCSITNVHVTGTSSITEATSALSYFGGLIGQASANCIIYNCSSNADVSGVDMTAYLGGLIGFGSGAFDCQKSFATGDIASSAIAVTGGGFIGYQSDGSIVDCYATGTVTIDGIAPTAGGFIGRFHSGTNSLLTSYSIGAVAGAAATIGGFCGYNATGSGTISDNYYDTTTSGQSDDTGKGEPINTAGMKKIATFENWIFEEEESGVWNISEDNSYPLFSIMPSIATVVYPTDTGSGISVTPTLEWAAGATYPPNSYNIYLGTVSGNLELLQGGRESTDVDILSGLHYNTTYYWRVDSIDQNAMVEGTEWSFTTSAFAPPLPTGITLDGDGEPTGDALGTNCIVTLKRLIAAANNKVFYET